MEGGMLRSLQGKKKIAAWGTAAIRLKMRKKNSEFDGQMSHLKEK